MFFLIVAVSCSFAMFILFIYTTLYSQGTCKYIKDNYPDYYNKKIKYSNDGRINTIFTWKGILSAGILNDDLIKKHIKYFIGIFYVVLAIFIIQAICLIILLIYYGD